MIPFTEDLSSFYATIYGGLLIGLLFDINRSLKSNFKILKYCSIVFNIVFWIIGILECLRAFTLHSCYISNLFINPLISQYIESKF